MVRFSEILNKISKKHGAKPTSPKPLKENEFQRPNIPIPESVMPGSPGHAPSLRGEPTQELSKGIMERLFQSVLETSPEGGPSAPGGSPFESASAEPSRPRATLSRPTEIRLFRNHAELMKFASLLIHDIEDALVNR